MEHCLTLDNDGTGSLDTLADRISLVSVVIPMHNEEPNVRPLCSELLQVANSWPVPCQVVIVNDGSTDGTGIAATAEAHRDSRIVCVSLPHRCGQTAALRSGLLRSTGDIVITMDGDLQNDPADIWPLITQLVSDRVALVTGWRYERHDPFWSVVLPSLIANRILAVVTGTYVHDTGCSLRAMLRETALRLPLYGHSHRYIPALVEITGGRVLERIVNHRSRVAARSKYSALKAAGVLGEIIRLGYLSRVHRTGLLLTCGFALTALCLALPFVEAPNLQLCVATAAAWALLCGGSTILIAAGGIDGARSGRKARNDPQYRDRPLFTCIALGVVSLAAGIGVGRIDRPAAGYVSTQALPLFFAAAVLLCVGCAAETIRFIAARWQAAAEYSAARCDVCDSTRREL